MRALALATTALAVLALAVPVRAETHRSGRRRRQRHAAQEERPRGRLRDACPSSTVRCRWRRSTTRCWTRWSAARCCWPGPTRRTWPTIREVKAQLARAHDGVLRDGVVKKAIDQGITDEKLKAAYEAMKSQPGFAFEETRAAHILVADEAQALAIIKQLQGGADFTALAKEKSTDPSAKTNGGDLGFFRREAMVPEFAEAAFSHEAGHDQRQAGEVAVRLARDQGRGPPADRADLRGEGARAARAALARDRDRPPGRRPQGCDHRDLQPGRHARRPK